MQRIRVLLTHCSCSLSARGSKPSTSSDSKSPGSSRVESLLWVTNGDKAEWERFLGTGHCRRSSGAWKGGHFGLYSSVLGLNVDRQCPLAFLSGTVARVILMEPLEFTGGPRRGVKMGGRILREKLSHLRSRLILEYSQKDRVSNKQMYDTTPYHLNKCAFNI